MTIIFMQMRSPYDHLSDRPPHLINTADMKRT